MRISKTILNQIKADQMATNQQNSQNFSETLNELQNMLDGENKFQNSNIKNAINEAKKVLNSIENEQSELKTTLKQLEAQAKQDNKMFKTFDFMQLMNQLIYGNNNEQEKNKIYKKMQEIVADVK